MMNYSNKDVNNSEFLQVSKVCLSILDYLFTILLNINNMNKNITDQN